MGRRRNHRYSNTSRCTAGALPGSLAGLQGANATVVLNVYEEKPSVVAELFVLIDEVILTGELQQSFMAALEGMIDTHIELIRTGVPGLRDVIVDEAYPPPRGTLARLDGFRTLARCLPRSGRKHVLDHVLAERGLLGQFDRIITVEACAAQPRPRFLGGRDHTLGGNVAQAVRTDRGADSVEHLVIGFHRVGDKFGRGSEVDAVEAWPAHRRRAMRTCTSAAPASRSIRTSARCVLPRTIESSTTTRRLPRMTSRRG